MSSWAEAGLFGLTILTIVLGVSSLLMGIIPSPTHGMKEKVEYGFFGVSSIVISVLLIVAIVWQP